MSDQSNEDEVPEFYEPEEWQQNDEDEEDEK